MIKINKNKIKKERKKEDTYMRSRYMYDLI